MDFGRFGSSGEFRREELIRSIEHGIEQLSVAELEAVYYDLISKGYIEKGKL